ncbi:Uncharacterized protein Fot_10199 [Forsythia ovata]|uniref:Uncharacterized protein n=1 Tax=Forsythia ovata TaxID=205694 RepID=A0ABD1WG65_9LAMI
MVIRCLGSSHNLHLKGQGQDCLQCTGTRTCFFVKEKVSKVKLSYLCQKFLDQASCKSRDVHEWQGPEEESQQTNPQDRPPQYFSENLSHTEIKPTLSENFSPRQMFVWVT